MAEWARRPPFYVLGNGPAAGGGRPLRRRAPGVLRHRDVRFGDAARPGLGAVQQVHGRAVRHPDGRRAACPRPPPADAGVLVAADRAAPGEHHRDRRRHARPHRGQRPRVRRHAGLRRASRRRCLARRHGGHGRAAQGDLRRVPRPAFRAPPTSSRASRGRRSCGAPSIAPWTRSRSSSRSGASARAPDFISDLVNARDAGDKLNDRELFDQIFGICGALAVGNQPRRRRRALSALHPRRSARSS